MMTQDTTLANEADDDPRWIAVLERDATRDSSFVYAVTTTGVYCRPSCGARKPRPENVAFYNTSAEAERAGFRSCKRCKPRRPTLSEQQAALVADLCQWIESREPAPTLDEIAARAGMSPSHLHRVFKKVCGLTPKEYALAIRAKRTRSALSSTEAITEAVYEAGYGSNGRFYENTDAILGMTPSAFRRGGESMRARFAVGECSVGSILVAATERGVCAILLGDDPACLVRDLEDRFPNAELVGGDREFDRFVATVVGFVEAPDVGSSLPLDIRGTAFQQRVWKALQDIPMGSTRTYSEIATAVGAPDAARAVANACAANALAVAIPCHRVVRTDGALSGYRWGIERKRELLTREQRATGSPESKVSSGHRCQRLSHHVRRGSLWPPCR